LFPDGAIRGSFEIVGIHCSRVRNSAV
jgi:hypothetical protein